uniref:Leucine-rich repeat-containing N-terminal plant-type domain-containing protein n=1 Tax=Leersia perrieri TaxID=77586 RepID=A0A0D9VXR8_9ORYZ
MPTVPSEAAAMQAIVKSIHADTTLGWRSTSHVTSISASRAGLVGHLLGTDLARLMSLSELDPSFNRLSGDLPILPLPLCSLTTLHLRSNVFLNIPDGFFGAFPALETFSLDDNNMPMRQIPADVIGCSHLRSISANNASINSPFPEFFGNATLFPVLESLLLARNELCCGLSTQFGQNSKIKFLDMSGQLHVDDSAKFSSPVRFLAGMTSLVEIHMGPNDLYGPLPDVSGLVNLKVFDATDNDLCGPVNFPPGVAVNVAGNPRIGKDCSS